jgi:FdhD protein
MRATSRHSVLRLGGDGPGHRHADLLAGEEPLEIRVAGAPFSVTMRTPGDDFDLVAGFLLSEGVIWDAGQIATMSYGPGVNPDGSASYNIVDVRLGPDVAPPDPSLQRHVYTSSSCGICGTASIEAVRKSTRFDPSGADLRLPVDEVLALSGRMRAGQRIFDRTGGVHAAGLFSVDDAGRATLDCLREDVGRHNAVDKVLGWALREGRLPGYRSVLQVSGRASFELVQKAQMAGVPVLAAVSAPSALSVTLAAESGMTLVGFSRGTSVSVYSSPERIVGRPAAHPS